MHLDAYGKNQKIYDAFSNEWGCCEEFGAPSPDEFLDDDGIDDDFPMMPPPSSAVEDQAMGPDTPLANPPVLNSPLLWKTDPSASFVQLK